MVLSASIASEEDAKDVLQVAAPLLSEQWRRSARTPRSTIEDVLHSLAVWGDQRPPTRLLSLSAAISCPPDLGHTTTGLVSRISYALRLSRHLYLSRFGLHRHLTPSSRIRSAHADAV